VRDGRCRHLSAISGRLTRVAEAIPELVGWCDNSGTIVSVQKVASPILDAPGPFHRRPVLAMAVAVAPPFAASRVQILDGRSGRPVEGSAFVEEMSNSAVSVDNSMLAALFADGADAHSPIGAGVALRSRDTHTEDQDDRRMCIWRLRTNSAPQQVGCGLAERSDHDDGLAIFVRSQARERTSADGSTSPICAAPRVAHQGTIHWTTGRWYTRTALLFTSNWTFLDAAGAVS
jgi:hypothetical protein